MRLRQPRSEERRRKLERWLVPVAALSFALLFIPAADAALTWSAGTGSVSAVLPPVNGYFAASQESITFSPAQVEPFQPFIVSSDTKQQNYAPPPVIPGCEGFDIDEPPAALTNGAVAEVMPGGLSVYDVDGPVGFPIAVIGTIDNHEYGTCEVPGGVVHHDFTLAFTVPGGLAAGCYQLSVPNSELWRGYWSGTVATLTVGNADCGTLTTNNATPGSPGYWKNHRSALLPLLPISLGSYSVTTGSAASAVFAAMNCSNSHPSNAAGCLAGELVQHMHRPDRCELRQPLDCARLWRTRHLHADPSAAFAGELTCPSTRPLQRWQGLLNTSLRRHSNCSSSRLLTTLANSLSVGSSHWKSSTT